MKDKRNYGSRRPYARLTTEELAERKAYYENWRADPNALAKAFPAMRLAEIAAELAHRQEPGAPVREDA